MASLKPTRAVSIKVDLKALRHNLAVARRCSKGSRLFATIKSDAYGHGAVAVAQALIPKEADSVHRSDKPAHSTAKSGLNADGFAVVTLNEALELRDAGIASAILVLQGPQTKSDCMEMERQNLWPVIHDLNQYAWYKQLDHKSGLNAWLKVDTGMGRLGVSLEAANRILATGDGINWMGLMTHFASADEVDNPFTQHQLVSFNSINSMASMQRSLANSAAVLAWPQTHADWVRPGIMLYGCNPLNRELPDDIKLRPVMSVSAPLISVKRLPAGAGVGYAQRWHCPENMNIGYAAVGYGDGLPRVLDDTAAVSIRGHRCPIVGRVSMDSIALDLRALPNAQIGDAVELWGQSAAIDSLAHAAGTIHYELLTSIRGKRSYIN